MLPLVLIIHIFLGAALAGSAVVVALTLGYGTLIPILIAAAIGSVAAFPLSWAIAKRIA